MSARDEVLGRIRQALAGQGPAPGEGAPAGLRLLAEAEGRAPVEEGEAYVVAGALGDGERLELFAERLAEYGVDVRRGTLTGIAEAVASALRDHGARNAVVPEGFPSDWRAPGVDWLEDGATSLGARELDEVDAVVTGCALGIAETGTLALDGGGAQGRRAITLVPDVHVCVVMADQVVETVPEAVRALEDAVREGRPVTLVSGPSATSDIELSRVQGVHGPRTLAVILAAGEGSQADASGSG